MFVWLFGCLVVCFSCFCLFLWFVFYIFDDTNKNENTNIQIYNTYRVRLPCRSVEYFLQTPIFDNTKRGIIRAGGSFHKETEEVE